MYKLEETSLSKYVPIPFKLSDEYSSTEPKSLLAILSYNDRNFTIYQNIKLFQGGWRYFSGLEGGWVLIPKASVIFDLPSGYSKSILAENIKESNRISTSLKNTRILLLR